MEEALTEGTEPTDGLGPWKEFLCRACGLIYNEGEGDEDSGLAPGTRFEDIPEDWSCPVCGVRKQDFEPYVRRTAAEQEAQDAPPAIVADEDGIVIVGAGIAGWSAAAAIRALDATTPITMVTQCSGDVYNKPELAIAFSRGMSPQKLCRERGADAARRLNVQLMPDTAAVGLSTRFKRLRTTRGTLPYKRLVLALGARSTLPGGLDPSLCWRINNLQAWSGLYRNLEGGAKSVVIIGAGMIGCEMAEDLAKAGHKISLLNLAGLPLHGLLPEPAAERLLAGLTGLGVDYHGGTKVSGVARDADGTMLVSRETGSSIRADHVIVAAGLAVQPRLIKTAGIEFLGGIVVDPSTLQTSAADVYALGDCVTILGAPCRFIEPISKQAEAIAATIAGLEHGGYQHRAPLIRLKTRCAPIVIEGSIMPQAEWRVVENTAETLVMEQWHEGQLRAKLVA